MWIDPRSGWIDTPVYAGWTLQPGQTIAGPAIVDEHTTTVLIGRGDTLSVDASGNYAIALRHDAQAFASTDAADDAARAATASAVK